MNEIRTYRADENKTFYTNEVQTYYTIEILITDNLGIPGPSYVEYRGEGVGYDWWNYSPVRFSSEDEAVNAINKSENYKDCDWRITKTTIIHEVKIECKNS